MKQLKWITLSPPVVGSIKEVYVIVGRAEDTEGNHYMVPGTYYLDAAKEDPTLVGKVASEVLAYLCRQIAGEVP